MNKKRLLTLVLLSTLVIGFISLFFVEIGSNPVKINNDSDNIDSPKRLVFNDLDGLRTSTSNVLSSKYLTINDKDNLYDSVYYWVNGSLYDSTNLFRDFQSGKLQTEYGTYSALNQNYTLLNDMNNDYWSNYSNNYDPTMGNGSYNDANGTFSSTNIGFNYDYLYHTSTNYNYSLYNQIFTAPDGSMSHNYQPDGYNSSYTINNKLYMQDLFPNEQFWEMWDSYSTTYDPSYTNSSFNKYNFITNATVEPGNGQWISGGINELKYYDSQYYKAKSSLYSGNQILYVDFDFTDGTPKWGELDGDYFLYFSCNTSMNFRDGNHETLWSGSQANGVYITDVDDWIYIFKEQVSPAFSIQIDYLFLLDPKLASELNDFVNYTVASNSSFYLLNGTLQSYGDLKEIDNDFSYNPLYNTGELTAGLTANIDDGGSRDWVDTDYSKISDDNRALCWNIPKNYGHGDYLEVYGFPSNIPSGSTIKGFIVQIEKKTNRSSSITDHHVQLVRAGIIEGTDKAKTGTYWQTFDNYVTYGANGDLWGLTWTVDQANNVGVVIGAENYDLTHAANAYVDSIRIDIYYNPPPPNCSVFQSGNPIGDYPAYESFNNMTTNYGEYWDERFTNKTTEAGLYYGTYDFNYSQDPFDAEPVGEYGMNIAWVSYSLVPANTTIASVAGNHSKVLMQKNGYCRHNFPEGVRFNNTVDFWVYPTATNKYVTIYLKEEYSPYTLPLTLQFNTAGQLIYVNGTGSSILIQTYSANVWYRFKIVWYSTNTFDLWLNDVKKVSGGTFTHTMSKGINAFCFYVTETTAYLDWFQDYMDPSHPYGYYYGSPDNFNDEPVGETVPNIAWIDGYSLPNSCATSIVSAYDNHKKALKLTHDGGASDPFVRHNIDVAQTSGTYEFWWGNSDATDTIYFSLLNQIAMGGVWLEIKNDKYYYINLVLTEVEIAGVVPTNGHLDHFKIYFNCATDTFDLYINGILRVNDGEFGYASTTLGYVILEYVSNVADSTYLDAPSESWAPYYNIGWNINPYLDLKNLVYTDIFTMGDDVFVWNTFINVEQYIDGHQDVVQMESNNTVTGSGFQKWISPYQTSGTIELWLRTTNASRSFDMVLYESSWDCLVQFEIANGRIYYNNGTTWKYLCHFGSNQWYHLRVDFETGAGAYAGLSADTWHCYINGTHYGNYNFANNHNSNDVGIIYFQMYKSFGGAYSYYIDALGFSWDTTSHGGKGYKIGYDINPYDITQLISIPYFYLGLGYGMTMNITSNFQGHKDVLIEKYVGSTTPNFYPSYLLIKTSGSMEFWYLTGNNTKGVWFDAYDTSWNALITLWLGTNGYVKYSNGTTWITLVAIGSNCWQHIRIDFETGAGTYQSLSADTWQIYVNGTKYGAYAFCNGINGDNVRYVRICEPTSTNTIHAFDSFCFSWDTSYLLGDNINSYNISAFKSKGWTMNYAYPNSYIRMNASVDGHTDVLEMCDRTGTKDTTNDFIQVALVFTAQTSGTVEYWVRSKNVGYAYYIYLRSGSNNRITVAIISGKFQAYYSSAWHDISGGSVSSNIWYHIRIEFECGSGAYKGLTPDTYNFYINGLFKETIKFQFGGTTLDKFYVSTTDAGYGSAFTLFLDAIAFSWIPGYTEWGNFYTTELNFISTIQIPDLYNKYSNDTFDYITLHYSFKTNISTVASIYAYNFVTSEWTIINSSYNKNGFYDCVFSLSSSYFNSTKYFKIRIIGGNDTGNRFELYLEMLRIDYKWTKTSGNIYTILSKSTIFDFLNQYDTGFDDYLKLFKFDYIFTYRYTNFTAYTKVAKFNGVSLTTDGSWHTADFYSIYDSSTGDGTINLEFNISNGLLEVRTFKYTMWFGCIDAVNGRRQLQQIFSVEWPYGGSLSDYVAENGMFFINVKYNFTTVNDGYLYTNTYDRHNKLEIHYAVKADGTWYYAMWSTNTTSIITNTRVVNVTDMMESLGLTKFEDFAVTFIMIGNNSIINVFNVSLWDKRAVVPAKLNFTVYHDFSVSDYVLDYMKLLYGWNTTNYNLVKIYIYCFNNNSWYLLKSGYNKGAITYNTFETYALYAKYLDSDNKTLIKIECGQNYTHNYKLNLRTKYNYRTGVWVSYELAFDERGTWRYRFVLVSSGVEYYTSWVYFDVVEPKPNFRAVSSSDYITTWVLTQNATSSEILRFEDDLDYGAWILTSPSNKYLSYNVQPNDDGYVSNWSPNQNYGWSSSIDIMTLVGSGHPGGITYGFVEDSHAETYLNDNNTASRPQSTFNLYAWYDPYWEEPLGSGSTNWYYTYDFNENTLTWNNMPAQNGFLVNLPYPGIWTWGQISLNYKLPIYLRIQPGDSTSDLRFDSAEGAQGYKCYFTHYVPKSYHNSTLKYWYMQTSISETLEMTSPEYPTGTQVYTNDYIKVDCQTTSSSMDVIFLLGGVPVKTVPLMRGNTNYNRQIVEVLLDSDVYFDQIRFSGPFSTGKYFKCFDVKILGLDKKSESVVERDVANEAEIFALAGINCLKIYERGILKVSKYVTLSYDYNELWVETYIGSLLGECHFAYQDENNEPLSFDYFKTYVNYTADNSTILNEQLFTNFLYVDENTYITFTVYDTFDVVILTTTQMERIFVELILPVYSLKIQNGATEQVYYALTKNTSSVAKSGKMFSSEIVEYKIASGGYNLAYINYEDSIVRNTNFTFANNKLISINTTYYQLYVSCFNFDGLGLDTDWVRLYINNLRKDFGFNALKSDYTRFVVLDFFNATLTNETVCTRIYTEYNLYIQVYNMILNNNYTHSIFITIERPSVNITIKQIVPAQSSINYRFLPGIDYNISYYYINGTRIGSVNITLVDNNQIVSFGYYSVEVPSPYYQLLVSCFNYNGFKLDTTWVYLYVNGIRADFGFNVMGTEYNLFVITDLFGELLSSEIVYTKNLTQYNADVTIYGMILNNNYTHSIYIELTRPNMSLIMKQIMPAQSGALYRFCPDTDYVISYYYINGTKIDEIRVTLETDNQVVSFGWYAVEVPAGPSNELIMGQMWLDIVVIVSCFVVIITFTLYLLRKYIKRNKEQQKYIYNTNKSKTNLEVESLLGKTHYFK